MVSSCGVCFQVEPLQAADNSDEELETALLGVRQREKAKNKKLKKKEMKKASRLRGIIASGTNHGTYHPPKTHCSSIST